MEINYAGSPMASSFIVFPSSWEFANIPLAQPITPPEIGGGSTLDGTINLTGDLE